MPRIDAHQHFWEYSETRDTWITPEMSVIRNNFMPEHLQPILAQHHIDGCIAVQSDQTDEHTHWLLSLATANTYIKGVVGWTDLQSPHLEQQLELYRQYPLLKGFRHILQGETNRALMLEPDFTKGIAALGKAGYVYDILIYPDQLPYTAQLAGLFPAQVFVLDHIAKPAIKTGDWQQWAVDIQALAAHEHVYCKVSGMVTEADWHQWQPQDIYPCLDVVTAAFGTNRLLYGSDWPVCLLAANYSRMLQLVTNYYSRFSAAEQEAIFGENAIRVYRL
ncbi:amidohydrolase family protein [Deminuibacter soli]|uniref:Amidohydrolase n=1 Tax=Deminuibacter soli TaxID=2291815 RepID=A0A3E1NKX8_9BACT|nr:amidohydrolase family protein [Deminuibacter soli]RFM28590.1 amidohydrolase [Deminuibacter soli]